MKKIYIFTFTTVLVVSLLIVVFGTFGSIMKPKTIMQVFETTDVNVLKTSIYCKGLANEHRLENVATDMDFFADTADKIISYFSVLPKTIENDRNESDSYIQYRIHGQTSEKELVAVTMWSEKKNEREKSDIYISLELLNDDIYGNLEIKKRQMQEVIQPFVSQLKTSLSITGTYSGQIDERKIEQIAKKHDLNSTIRYSRYEDKTYITLTSTLQ